MPNKSTNLYEETSYYYSGMSLLPRSGAFVVGLNLGGISGALEFITAEFGLSAMAMGLVTSAIMIGCLIGALLGGRYSDKYGRKT